MTGIRHIEDGICHVTYPKGKMLLAMDKFFPAPADDVRQLFLKTIALNWERWDIAQEILEWLEDRVRDLDAEAAVKARANAYVDKMAEAEAMKANIEKQAMKVGKLQDSIRSLPKNGKKPYQDRLAAEKETLRHMKEKRSALKKEAKAQADEATRIQSLERKLAANIRLIGQITEKW